MVVSGFCHVLYKCCDVIQMVIMVCTLDPIGWPSPDVVQLLLVLMWLVLWFATCSHLRDVEVWLGLYCTHPCHNEEETGFRRNDGLLEST